MSRGRNKQKTTDGPPPSHPQENFVEHRNFLIRSLQRNDVDIAALVELNRSLKAAKASILESCGEPVLLDLGVGRLTLVNDELHEDTKSNNNNNNKDEGDDSAAAATHHLTPVQKAVCVDFLLRMKLRRKLCNRLARRLNRVAHAMDGEDVAPPPPPRYGELRLNMDPSAVAAKAEHWERLEQAKKAIQEAKREEEKERQQQQKLKLLLQQQRRDQLAKQAAAAAAAAAEEKEKAIVESSSVKEEKEAEATIGQPQGAAIDGLQQAPNTDAIVASGMNMTEGEGVVPMDVEPSSQLLPQQPPKAPEAILSSLSSSSTPSVPRKIFKSPDHVSAALAPHYDVIKEYDTAYEKIWDRESNRFKYVIGTEMETEPEYTQIKQGIGGAARAMSVQEREAEHKRWQTAILSRIPDQPTFEDLGLKNRVFCYEARKKRCLELEQEEEQDDDDDKDADDKDDDKNDDDGKDDDGEKEPKKLKTEDAEDTDMAKTEHVNNPVQEDEVKEDEVTEKSDTKDTTDDKSDDDAKDTVDLKPDDDTRDTTDDKPDDDTRDTKDDKPDEKMQDDKETEEDVKEEKKPDEEVRDDVKPDEEVKDDVKPDEEVKDDAKPDEEVKDDAKTDEEVKEDKEREEDAKDDKKTEDDVKEDNKQEEEEKEDNKQKEDAKVEEPIDTDEAAKKEPSSDMEIDDDKSEKDTSENDSDTEEKKEQKTSDDDDDDSSDMFGDSSSKEEEKDETMKKSDGDDESSDMFEADEDEDSEEQKSKEEKPKPDSTNTSEPPKPVEKEKDASSEEKKEEPEPEKKPLKPMNLSAVPSFHDQDMARIRMIHGDLIATSMMEHARKRLTDVTRDYNNAFRASNELYEQRQRLQQSLNFFIAKSRSDLAKATNDYQLEVAIAKQRWMKQKREYDIKRSQSAMPTNWGHKPYGTPFLQNHIQRAQDIRALLGTCLADVVDGAIMIAEGKVQNKKFGDFVPPPNPNVNKQTGETLAAQHLKMENQIKMQMNAITTKFNTSEEERNRLWKKMMKAKADLELPQQQYSARRGRVDYTKMPLPQLRSSSTQTMPRELDYARTALATYTPPQRSTGLSQLDMGGSDSKYSAARVRERIGNDGTVAPVTEPKKTKEGLYQRPAGRTRKGMQWDAIRGIWVPEGSQ